MSGSGVSDSSRSGRKRWIVAPRLFVASLTGLAATIAASVVWTGRPDEASALIGWMARPAAIVVAILAIASAAGLLGAVMQTRRDRWLAALLIVASAASLWQPVGFPALERRFLSGEVTECPVGDFTLQDIGGEVVELAELAGRVVLVDVWATWCGPCIAELPYLTYADRLLREEGLTILGISDEPAEIQQPIRDEYGVSYPLLIDDGSLPRPFADVNAWPSTFLIDRDGCIVDRRVRGVEGLRRLIREVRGRDEPIPWFPASERPPAVGGGGP